MDRNILILLVILLVFFGGFGAYSNPTYRGHYGGGVGLLVLILVLFLLFGR